jgi:2-dehydropantoate 2-reductase
MRIAAMAAGAVGGYFASRLAAAAHEVFFIARVAHREAIAKYGLRVESVLGDLHLPKPNVSDDPAKIGPVDLVLFAVKLWDTEQAAEKARPLIGNNTRVITLQNGVDSIERIAPILGAEWILGGTAIISATIAAPGIIRHLNRVAEMHFGHSDHGPDQMLDAFLAASKAAKIDAVLSRDIEREMWEKFISLTALSGATASLRAPIGAILADSELRDFFRALMQEAFAVGKARGVTLDSKYVDRRMDHFINEVEPSRRASMAYDLEHGRRLELDWLTGKVRTLGRELAVPTPASDAVYRILKLHRLGRLRA